MKQHLLGIAALLIFAWGMGPGTNAVRAQEAGKPAAKTDEPAKEAAADEPVETLEKKADKPDAAAEKTEPAADKSDAPKEAKGPAAKPKGNLTDQLLDGLGVKGQIEAAGNPLDAIVERMRDVKQRLQKTETDKETRELQTQIVKDLDELIEKLKNQKPPPPMPNQNPPPPDQGGEKSPDTPPRGSPQPKPQNSQKQRGGSEDKQSAEQKRQQQLKQQQGEAGEKNESKKARNSDNQQRQTRSAEEEAARQRMAKDVWGHLPAALRQELLNVYSEKYLPKYDEMVRKYYEALAEQNRRTP